MGQGEAKYLQELREIAKTNGSIDVPKEVEVKHYNFPNRVDYKIALVDEEALELFRETFNFPSARDIEGCAALDAESLRRCAEVSESVILSCRNKETDLLNRVAHSDFPSVASLPSCVSTATDTLAQEDVYDFGVALADTATLNGIGGLAGELHLKVGQVYLLACNIQRGWMKGERVVCVGAFEEAAKVVRVRDVEKGKADNYVFLPRITQQVRNLKVAIPIH